MTDTKTPSTPTKADDKSTKTEQARNDALAKANVTDPADIAGNTPPQSQDNNQMKSDPMVNGQSTKTLVPPTPAATTTAAKPGDQPAVNTISDNTPLENQIATDPAADLSKDEEAKLEKILDGEVETGPASLSDEQPDLYTEALNKIKRLVINVPATSPDEHTIWGAGGVILTLGDLRAIVKHLG